LKLARPKLDKAVEILESAGVDEGRVRAVAVSFLGSLLKDLRLLEEAESCLRAAARLFRQAGDERSVTKVRLKFAQCRCLAGFPREALEVLLDSLRSLDHFRNQRLALVALHNLCFRLCELDESEVAQRLFDSLKPIYERHGDSSIELRRHWLNAKIQAGLGSTSAESTFRRALDSFLEAKQPFLAAFVALELAALLVEANRPGEVVEIAAFLPSVFEAEGVHREAIAAAVVFKRAALRREVDAALIHKLHSFLKRSQADPNHEFRF
jgi:tetratricopeptide (TPR) repeat protein